MQAQPQIPLRDARGEADQTHNCRNLHGGAGRIFLQLIRLSLEMLIKKRHSFRHCRRGVGRKIMIGAGVGTKRDALTRGLQLSRQSL